MTERTRAEAMADRLALGGRPGESVDCPDCSGMGGLLVPVGAFVPVERNTPLHIRGGHIRVTCATCEGTGHL